MIRLQFVSERTVGSWLIRYVGSGDLSHVDAILPDGKLLGARFDLTEGGLVSPGVQIRRPNYHPFKSRVEVEIYTRPAATGVFYDFLRSQIGKPYDRLAILAFATNRNWREPDSWICSELIARALEVAGVFPGLYLATNKIAPTPLALAVSALRDVRFLSQRPA